MRRHTKIVWVLGAVVLLAPMCWLLVKPSSEKELVYQGRTLSEWLDIYGTSNKLVQADEAFRQMDTNAIPGLLEWINYAISGEYIAAHEMRPNNAQLESNEKHRQWRASAAIQAFKALGPVAEPAIPALVRSLRAPREEAIAYRAAQALTYIGPKASVTLFTALTNKNPGFCYAAIIGALRLNPNTNYLTVVPNLIACLQHPNEQVAGNAARALGALRLAPEAAIPALIKTAYDKRQMVSYWAMYSLGYFGPQASNALPVLIENVRSKDSFCYKAATNAIQKIDPNALPK